MYTKSYNNRLIFNLKRCVLANDFTGHVQRRNPSVSEPSRKHRNIAVRTPIRTQSCLIRRPINSGPYVFGSVNPLQLAQTPNWRQGDNFL